MIFDKKEKFRVGCLNNKANIQELFQELDKTDKFVGLDPENTQKPNGLVSLRIDGEWLEGSYVAITHENNKVFDYLTQVNLNKGKRYKNQCDFFIKDGSYKIILSGDRKAEDFIKTYLNLGLFSLVFNLEEKFELFSDINTIKGELTKDLVNEKYTIKGEDAQTIYDESYQDSFLREIRGQIVSECGHSIKLSLKNNGNMEVSLVYKPSEYTINDIYRIIGD